MSINFFLHIGLHKTGTSFLQQHVFPSWPGLYYVGKPYHYQFVEPVLWDSNISTVLISNEQFSSPPLYPVLLEPLLRKKSWCEQRKLNLLRLKELFPNVKVIMGVRNPADFCESVYSQYIFRGGVVAEDGFWDPDGKGCLSPDDLDFNLLIDFVESLWPGSFFFDHEDLRDNPEALFLEMASFMGLSEIPPIVTQDVNVRLSQNQISSMRRYSLSQVRRPGDKKSFNQGLKDVCENSTVDQAFSFPLSIRESVIEHTNSSWMKAKLKLSF